MAKIQCDFCKSDLPYEQTDRGVCDAVKVDKIVYPVKNNVLWVSNGEQPRYFFYCSSKWSIQHFDERNKSSK